MNYKIAICDDEQFQLELLSAFTSEWSSQSGCSADIHTFPSSEAFLFSYEADRSYDILLLDVEMEGISGIELAKRLRQAGSRAEIIFVTSHFEFIGEGYEVDALHYLMKPVSAGKLASVLSRAAQRLCAEPPSVILSCSGETVKLYEEEILYVESFLHYISIHTKDQEYRIKESISAFEARLGSGFYRTHRSYLVSLKHIIKISRTTICMDDHTVLPLARGKYDAVNRAFIEHN